MAVEAEKNGVVSEVSEDRPRAIIRDAGEGDALWTMGQLWTLKARSAETAGELAAMEVAMPAAAAPPLHIHHHEAEVMYVLEGEITFRCGDEVRTCGPGGFVYLPHGVPHAFLPGPQGTRVLALVVPGGLENLYQEVGEPASELRLPDLPPEVAKWMQLSHRYGIEVIGPPLRAGTTQARPQP